jgi:hypothetical protein
MLRARWNKRARPATPTRLHAARLCTLYVRSPLGSGGTAHGLRHAPYVRSPLGSGGTAHGLRHAPYVRSPLGSGGTAHGLRHAPYVRSPLGSEGPDGRGRLLRWGAFAAGPSGAADGGVRLARRGSTSVVGTLGRDALRRSPAARAPSSAALVTVGVRSRSSTHIGSSGGYPGSNPPEPQLDVHKARLRAETVRIPPHDGFS